MTAASRSLATAPWGARFASGVLTSCYTTIGDTTFFQAPARRSCGVLDLPPPSGGVSPIRGIMARATLFNHAGFISIW